MNRRTATQAVLASIAAAAHAPIVLARQTSQRGGGGASAVRDPGPVLTRQPYDRRDWTLKSEITLHGFQMRADNPENIAPTSRLKLEAAAIVWPIVPESAMHTVDKSRISGEVRIEGRVLDDAPRFVGGYQAGTELAIFDIKDIDCVTLTLHMSVAMTSCQTRIDEKRAMEIAWPTKPWSSLAASCLEPQLFVDPNDPVVAALVKEWTNNNPRKAGPYYLAKFLAGRVIDMFQPTEGAFESTGRGPQRGVTTAVLISGFHVNGSAYAAREKRGSPHDLACLLCAVYRAAGLPARLVIGYDVKDSQEPNKPRVAPSVRAWVEFLLFDEVNNREEWIPVDILRQRNFSSRAPAINQRWQFFGHNEEFDFMAPIAFHWHPPAFVTNSGAPSIWGWLPKPGNPVADQSMRFYAFETPKTTRDMKRR